MNCLLVANIGTGLANYAALREAAVCYSQAQLPGWLDLAIEDRLRAGAHTRITKSAFTTPEIDLWISAGTIDNDALGAGT